MRRSSTVPVAAVIGSLAAFGVTSSALALGHEGEITAGRSVVFAPAPQGFRPVPFDLPVTGGSGRYQNARGQIHVKFLGVADARFSFHLIA